MMANCKLSGEHILSRLEKLVFQKVSVVIVIIFTMVLSANVLMNNRGTHMNAMKTINETSSRVSNLPAPSATGINNSSPDGSLLEGENSSMDSFDAPSDITLSSDSVGMTTVVSLQTASNFREDNGLLKILSGEVNFTVSSPSSRKDSHNSTMAASMILSMKEPANRNDSFDDSAVSFNYIVESITLNVSENRNFSERLPAKEEYDFDNNTTTVLNDSIIFDLRSETNSSSSSTSDFAASDNATVYDTTNEVDGFVNLSIGGDIVASDTIPVSTKITRKPWVYQRLEVPIWFETDWLTSLRQSQSRYIAANSAAKAASERSD